MTGFAMLLDYHLHLAPDGEPLDAAALSLDRVRERVAVAVSRGVEEIAVTEHVYRFAAARHLREHRFWQQESVADLERYRAVLAAASEASLPVIAGIELDWLAGCEAGLRTIAEHHRWDVVLGSVHWLGELAFDHPDYSLWEHVPVEEGWRRYVDALCDAAQSGIFDVLAHPDLAKVFGDRPSPTVLDSLYDQLVDALRSTGVCVEVSTAGLRKAAAEIYPAPKLLARCARAGIPATLGADAHVAADVGRDFPLAVAALRAAGYGTITRFREREPEQVPLG